MIDYSKTQSFKIEDVDHKLHIVGIELIYLVYGLSSFVLFLRFGFAISSLCLFSTIGYAIGKYKLEKKREVLFTNLCLYFYLRMQVQKE